MNKSLKIKKFETKKLNENYTEEFFYDDDLWERDGFKRKIRNCILFIK